MIHHRIDFEAGHLMGCCIGMALPMFVYSTSPFPISCLPANLSATSLLPHHHHHHLQILSIPTLPHKTHSHYTEQSRLFAIEEEERKKKQHGHVSFVAMRFPVDGDHENDNHNDNDELVKNQYVS